MFGYTLQQAYNFVGLLVLKAKMVYSILIFSTYLSETSG